MGSTPYQDFSLGWDPWLYSHFHPLHSNFRYFKDIFKLHRPRSLNKVCSCFFFLLCLYPCVNLQAPFPPLPIFRSSLFDPPPPYPISELCKEGEAESLYGKEDLGRYRLCRMKSALSHKNYSPFSTKRLYLYWCTESEHFPKSMCPIF